MRKSFITFFLIIVSFISFGQGKGKTGYLDLNALYNSMPELKTANEDYLKFYKELDTAVKTMEYDFKAKAKFYNDNAATLSDLVKQTKEKEIKDLQTQIQSFRQSAQEELTKKQNGLLEPIKKKAKDAVTQVAKEKGYKLILNYTEDNILYYEESDDILPFVKQKLGIK